MRRFSLYKRNGIFYVRFLNPETKKYTSAISTGERERRYAETQAAYWDQHGIDNRIPRRDSRDACTTGETTLEIPLHSRRLRASNCTASSCRFVRSSLQRPQMQF